MGKKELGSQLREEMENPDYSQVEHRLKIARRIFNASMILGGLAPLVGRYLEARSMIPPQDGFYDELQTLSLAMGHTISDVLDTTMTFTMGAIGGMISGAGLGLNYVKRDKEKYSQLSR